jgi:AsmA protein
MKRHLTISLVLFGALLAGAALVPWHRIVPDFAGRNCSPDHPRDGRGAVTGGDATFALLPYPRVKLNDVQFGTPGDSAVLAAPMMRGKLRLLPLIAGRIELAELSLADPVLRLGQGWPETSIASANVLRAAELLLATPASRGRIGKIAVNRGRIEQVAAAGTTAVIVSGLEGRLVATEAAATADVTGSFRWRGMDVEVTAAGLDPAEYGASRQTPIRLTVSSPLLTASFQGAASGPDLQFDGDLSASSPDLVALGGWLGFDPPLTSAGVVDIAGAVRLNADSLALSGARIGIDGQVLDGTVLARLNEGQLTVTGTLATGRFNGTSLKNALIPTRAQDGGWSREPFDLWRVPRADFDLRLSVGSLVIGGLTLDNAALALLSRGGKADLSLAGADFQKGTLKGKLGVSIGPRGVVETRLQANLDRADAGLVLGLLVDGRRLTGTASASLQMEGSGDSMAALMRSWNGKAQLMVRQGELVGVNLPEALRRVERRPLVAGLDLIGGRTPFDIATAGFRIRGRDRANNRCANPIAGRPHFAHRPYRDRRAGARSDGSRELDVRRKRKGGGDPAVRDRRQLRSASAFTRRARPDPPVRRRCSVPGRRCGGRRGLEFARPGRHGAALRHPSQGEPAT